ncbi:DUF2442 domain-containing protein [Burkholderia multivorans]|nr:DUF2442 domain-containing protein [Burkholderia multivorans]
MKHVGRRIARHIAKLTVLPGHRLAVEFADGLCGTLDLSRDAFNGVFAPLADETYFAQATVRNGVVTWPNGAELAPDAIYDEIRAAV